MVEKSEQNKPESEPVAVKAAKAALWAKLVDFGLEFAVIIALPLIGSIYLGRWLDNKYGTKFFVIIGLFVAIGLSNYIIYKRIKSIKDILK